ncbi:MAG: RNA-guided pseudouridylation complex pseudouridine synthase subunit Cbf5 [Thermofilaceae archaeon]|nr:RNA-guided pseudouridylation complex pseudouridine synthase subunit Cbf5 [Thermofilaceae archaeon]MDW8004571.1 RNA-guided pseudouridylation complex pseudouridine synthase subunit Cbf5 [Thermofilaceae archaeon]
MIGPSRSTSREVFVRDEEPLSQYGKRPEERNVEELIEYGVINLDKPAGPSSHEVVAWLRKLVGIGKVAHAGTLDPKVTGVLPILLNRSIKVVPYLLAEDKEYVGVLRLHGDVSEEDIRRAVSMFKGSVYQRPPLRSAVKRVVRVRKIYDVKVLEVSGRDVLFWMWCEAGTYVRKFCHDVGLILGVGAHMQELRRIRSGSLKEEESVTLHDVVDAFSFWKEEGDETFIRRVITPVEKVVEHLPRVVVRDSSVDAIARGAMLAVPGILAVDAGIKVDDVVAIFTKKNELVAIGKALMRSEQMITAKKGEAIKPESVLMKPGTYPSLWHGKKKVSEKPT